MSNRALASDAKDFIHEAAGMMMLWGMPAMPARLFAYLLLQQEPASLDQIADELEMSKSTASVAARLLERYLLIRRQGERGTKRVYYEVSSSYVGFLLEEAQRLGAFGEFLKKRASVAPSKITVKRLKQMSGFFLGMQESMTEAVARLSAKIQD
jgi:DNA-binding transcriptional regulator GbsR (MarR family)